MITIILTTPHGDGIEPDGMRFFDDPDSASAYIKGMLKDGDRVFIQPRGGDE